MNENAKADRMDECFRIGEVMYELDNERRSLLREIRQLENVLNDLNARIGDIINDIGRIQFAQDAARAAGSRGGVPGSIMGEVTAQAIRLAMQKGELEQQKHQLEAQRTNLERKLNEKRRRFEEVDYNFDQFSAGFGDRDCPLGARKF